MASLVDLAIRGLVALVLTSPAYAPSPHGRVTAPRPRRPQEHDRYSTDPANLAHVGLAGLLDAMRVVMRGAAQLLRPDGIVAMTVRPWRSAGCGLSGEAV